MRSVEMKNRCLLYYGNPVGYRTEQGVVADSTLRREELEDWLARKGKLGGQHKVPRLSNTREYIETMLVLNNE